MISGGKTSMTAAPVSTPVMFMATETAYLTLYELAVAISSEMLRAVSFPLLRARSFIITKKTGTRIRTWMVEVIMPPTIGAAIGFITSEPMPDSQRIGTRLARTAHTVMSFGRKR